MNQYILIHVNLYILILVNLLIIHMNLYIIIQMNKFTTKKIDFIFLMYIKYINNDTNSI